MKPILATAVSFLLLYTHAGAQTITVVDNAKLPRFEIVSVKPGDPNAFTRGQGFRPGGGFFSKDTNLVDVFMLAFGLRPQQLLPVPDFVQRQAFTIEARAPGAPVPDIQLML